MIRRVPVNGGVAELADEGPEAAAAGGLPVVLLHGFTGNKDSWLELRERLRTARRVLSLDLPGRGATAIDAARTPYSIENTARIAIEALDALNIARFALIGYSMGGRLALFIALEYPSRVERLMLESASAGIADPGEREARRNADEELASFAESAGISAFVDRWENLPLFDSQRALPAAVRERIRGARLSCSPAGLAASLRGMGAGSQPWLGDRLGELKIPVLIAVGVLDAKYMKIGAEMARGISCARLAAVPGAGHTPHLERPAEFNRIVTEFLGTPAQSGEERQHEH